MLNLRRSMGMIPYVSKRYLAGADAFNAVMPVMELKSQINNSCSLMNSNCWIHSRADAAFTG